MPNSDAVFVDTSGWIAVLNADDHLHAPAVERLQRLGTARRRLVTTDWIFAETGNGLARPGLRTQFVRAVKTFLQSGNSQLVQIDGVLFNRALELYEQVADKTWGLVDCASFVVMRDEGIIEAIARDRHFEQAGFRCLLPMAKPR